MQVASTVRGCSTLGIRIHHPRAQEDSWAVLFVSIGSSSVSVSIQSEHVIRTIWCITIKPDCDSLWGCFIQIHGHRGCAFVACLYRRSLTTQPNPSTITSLAALFSYPPSLMLFPRTLPLLLHHRIQMVDKTHS